MHTITVLLVAAEKLLTDSVRDALASLAPVQVEVVPSCAEAALQLEKLDPALVLIHVAAPEEADNAAVLLRCVTTVLQDVATVILSEPDLAEDGLKLLRLGAADWLMRPLDLSRLAYLAEVLTVRHRLAPRPELPAPAVDSDHDLISLPGGPLSFVLEEVRRVAPLETNILLQGETGTGKTRLALLIHELSPRRDHPFLTINCGALSANVIESELFGHVRGAFTGADRDRTGKLAAVGKGTLLLDDIDGLPLELQAKLLQVIEERVFVSVGSNQPQVLRARVIAASNRLLPQEARAGRFRADLYYRLGVVEFYVPPLRENRAMVPALAKRFVRQYAERAGRPVRGLMPAALHALENHDWPGNVRELRNVIERAVALCPGEWVGLENLPRPLQASSRGAQVVPPSALVSRPSSIDGLEFRLQAENPAKAGTPTYQSKMDGTLEPMAGTTLAVRRQETEAQVISEVLNRNRNNKVRTAAELGISRMTLYKKLYQYGLMNGTAPA